MTDVVVILKADSADFLASLADAAQVFLEFRDALLCFLDSGEEFIRLDSDACTASVTGELIVRLQPSDALLGLMTTFRARYRDLFAFEHDYSLVAPLITNTTSDSMQ
jgi:hypothetical protein